MPARVAVPVAVVGEGDAGRQGPDSASATPTGTPGVEVIVKEPAVPTANVAVGALLTAGASSTVRSERLRDRRTDAVVSVDHDRPCAAGTGGGSAGEGGGAIAVVGEGDAAG